MARVFESNGPDVKIRGNPSHIAEKYIQLARDSQASGDPIAAENYFQHAEHYLRVIASAQEQFRQNNPHLARPENEISNARDDGFDDGDDEGQTPVVGAADQPFGTREPQPFLPRDSQPYGQAQNSQSQQPRGHQGGGAGGPDVDRLPSFITGGQQQPQQQPPSQNGHDNQPDRFPLHRRRRRHRGPRHESQGGGDGGESNSRGD